MPEYYVSSVDGNNADDGLTWGTAKQTVTGGLAVAIANGDVIYVDSVHDFTATLAITWDATTTDQYVSIISVDRGGRTGSSTGHDGWKIGATERVGAANAAFSIAVTRAQKMFIFGCNCYSGTNSNTACDINIAALNTAFVSLEAISCNFACPSLNLGATIFIGPGNGTNMLKPEIKMRNCTLTFAGSASATGCFLRCAKGIFSGLTIAFTGTKPNTCFGFSGGSVEFEIVDSDLSSYDVSGGAYFVLTNWQGGYVSLRNCKTSATPSVTSGSYSGAAELIFINTDSEDTNNEFRYANRLGVLSQSTTIYSQSGAKFNGTGICWQAVTSASNNEAETFTTPWVITFYTGTSPSYGDMEILASGSFATGLNNKLVWSELEYLSGTAFPEGKLISNRNSMPFDTLSGIGQSLTQSSEVWIGTGDWVTPRAYRLRNAFTAGDAGVVKSRTFFGWSGIGSIYVCPKIRISQA